MTDLVLPDLCDAWGDTVRVVDPVFRSYGGRTAFGGPVRTVKCHEDNSLVAAELEQPGAGRVLVVDGGGSLRCALLGDNLAARGAANGWAGVVVHGCVRDVEVLRGIDLGVQALAAHPRRSVKRGVGELDVAVQFPGVTIAPGMFVYGDENGLIVADRALLPTP
jgi:regulator of ribonuclease activity A